MFSALFSSLFCDNVAQNVSDIMSGSYVRLLIAKYRVVVLLGTAVLLLSAVYLHSQSGKGVLVGLDYRHSAEQQDTSKGMCLT